MRELPKNPGDMVRLIAWNFGMRPENGGCVVPCRSMDAGVHPGPPDPWMSEREPRHRRDRVRRRPRRPRAPRARAPGPLPRPAGEPPRQPRRAGRRGRRGGPDRPGLAPRALRGVRRSTTSPRTTGSGCGTRASSTEQRRRARENILAAAAAAGVCASSTRAPSARWAHGGRHAGRRDDPGPRDEIVGHYKRSKYLAERVAEGWAAQGLAGRHREPVDAGRRARHEADADGQIIVDFLNGKMPGLRRHRAEPRRRGRRRGGAPAGRGARPGRREIHPRQPRT